MDGHGFARNCGTGLVTVLVLLSSLIFTIFSSSIGAASPKSGGGAAVPKTAGDNQPRIRIVNRYGKIPLAFERNNGQTAPQVKFLSRGVGYTLFLTPTEAVLALHNPDKRPGAAKGPESVKNATQVLRVAMVGVNPKSAVAGEEQLPSKSNYFVGNDPKKWRTNIPMYQRVRYSNVYPGVDLVYYGTGQHQLEYDFVVAPGADPKALALRFTGATNLALNSDGDLRITLADGGEVIHHKPIVYQDVDGRREKVDGKCVLRGKDTIGFELAAYDRRRTVYIDPGLVYSTYLGGSAGASAGRNDDQGNAIAVDSSGNAYVTGPAASADFPTTMGAFQTTNNAVSSDLTNGFVTKLNAAGSALVYSTFLGGSGSELPKGIAVDSLSGDVYVMGRTTSIANASCTAAGTPNTCCTGPATGTCVAFPTTPSAFQTVNAGGDDTFVTKLNADGSMLVYSTLIGGSGDDKGNAIAVDSSGDAYFTGKTNSITNGDCTGVSTPKSCCTGVKTGSCVPYPTTSGAFQTSDPNAARDFVTKLNDAGSALVYSTYLGGTSGGHQANAIAVDSLGEAFVAGDTKATDFPTTVGAFQTTNKAPTNGGNGYLTKLNATGTGLVYSTYLGGSGNSAGQADSIDGIAVDSMGHAYATGPTFSSDFPTTMGAFQTTNNGLANMGEVAFVTKFAADGSALVYSTFLGGEGGDQGLGIALDSLGDAYVTGATSSFNPSSCTANGMPGPCCTGAGTGTCIGFPITGDAFQNVDNAAANGGSNAFMTKLNATGTALDYSTYLGGSSGLVTSNGIDDEGNGIAIDSSGLVYVTGVAISTDFPTTGGAFQTSNHAASGGTNAFVAKLMPFSSSPTPTATATSSASPTATSTSGTPTATATATATTTTTSTATNTATATATSTSGTPTATATATATATSTNTATTTATARATATGTSTATATATGTSTPTPTATATASATATATATATASATATPTPTPTPVGTLSISPNPVNFGSSTKEGKTKTKKVTIKNVSSKTSKISVTVSGENTSAPFSIKNGVQCMKVLAPGKSCKVSVTFTPPDAGAAHNGFLTVMDNAQNNPQMVPLTGTGKAP